VGRAVITSFGLIFTIKVDSYIVNMKKCVGVEEWMKLNAFDS